MGFQLPLPDQFELEEDLAALGAADEGELGMAEAIGLVLGR